MMIAVKAANLQIVFLLLDAGADPNVVVEVCGLPRRMGEGARRCRRFCAVALTFTPAGRPQGVGTALLLAVRSGFGEIAQLLLGSGANPNYKHTVRPLSPCAPTAPPQMSVDAGGSAFVL